MAPGRGDKSTASLGLFQDSIVVFGRLSLTRHVFVDPGDDEVRNLNVVFVLNHHMAIAVNAELRQMIQPYIAPGLLDAADQDSARRDRG